MARSPRHSNSIPTRPSETSRLQRATRYVDWAADHTGILRFHKATEGEEQLRFWHRLFREYLSAYRIAQEDSTADAKINQLWQSGRLLNPFWEDVIRLLPRCLGTIEKARSVLSRLDELAATNDGQRGRLLGLAAAAIIENRDLFPDVVFAERATQMARIFDREGSEWPLTDRVLFLDGLGRLDPVLGDPRLSDMRWVLPLAKQAKVGTADPDSDNAADILLGMWPVTVQEFRRFCEAEPFKSPAYWGGLKRRSRDDIVNITKQRVRAQSRYLNRPLVNVHIEAALAYCRWLTEQRADGRVVRLQKLGEWMKFVPARGRVLTTVDYGIGDAAKINWSGAGLERISPVGAFPPDHIGAYDIYGNVWEMGLPGEKPTRRGGKNETTPVFGSDFSWDPRVRGTKTDRMYTLVEDDFPVLYGHASIGFRCVLAKS